MRCVASCELPRLPGQQHGKIRLGTMLHELSVLFHIGLFFQWQNLSKRQSLKNWEMKLFLGIGMAKSSFFKKKEKSTDCYIWF
jgi:fluoride ion exporter CrcB/FEX